MQAPAQLHAGRVFADEVLADLGGEHREQAGFNHGGQEQVEEVLQQRLGDRDRCPGDRVLELCDAELQLVRRPPPVELCPLKRGLHAALEEQRELLHREVWHLGAFLADDLEVARLHAHKHARRAPLPFVRQQRRPGGGCGLGGFGGRRRYVHKLGRVLRSLGGRRRGHRRLGAEAEAVRGLRVGAEHITLGAGRLHGRLRAEVRQTRGRPADKGELCEGLLKSRRASLPRRLRLPQLVHALINRRTGLCTRVLHKCTHIRYSLHSTTPCPRHNAEKGGHPRRTGAGAQACGSLLLAWGTHHVLCPEEQRLPRHRDATTGCECLHACPCMPRGPWCGCSTFFDTFMNLLRISRLCTPAWPANCSACAILDRIALRELDSGASDGLRAPCACGDRGDAGESSGFLFVPNFFVSAQRRTCTQHSTDRHEATVCQRTVQA